MPVKVNSTTGKLEHKGKVIEINDHVLVSAPWPDREGEPYLVARVLELLPAISTTSTSSSTSSAVASSSTSKKVAATTIRTNGARVRVNYYLRPRDITSRYVSDFRLVVATMHADVIPIQFIRAACTVQHKEHITDMAAFKAKPDSFYWYQVYDRYLHRYFDAVPVNKVQNAPPDVINHLTTHFEFILCEPAMTNELCDAQRGCSVCSKWAANSDSVTCARCAKVFHLGCVDPPLAQKPRAGWAWACAPCARAHEDEVDAYIETGAAPTKLPEQKKSTKPNGKGISVPDSPAKPTIHSGTATPPVLPAEAIKVEKEKEKDEDGKPIPHASSRLWRMMNGWPFRYYGMHTPSNSVLDPHDSIYPRTGTRLGHRYQINIPAWDYSKNTPELAPNFHGAIVKPRTKVANSSGLPRPRKKKVAPVPIINRGEDEELVTVIADPARMIEEKKLDRLVEEVAKLTVYRHAGVDTINKALELFLLNEQHDVDAVLEAMQALTPTEMGYPPWSEADRKKLADGVAKHLNDIDEIRKSFLPTKKMRDVVKRYYIYLGHLVQEDVPAQMDERTLAASASSPDKIRRSRVVSSALSKSNAKANAAVSKSRGHDSDGESVVDVPKAQAATKKDWMCSICDTKITPKWYLCPDTLNDALVTPDPCVMCQECGIRWRHYGIQYASSPTEDLSITAPLPEGILSRAVLEAQAEAKAKARPQTPPVASTSVAATSKPAAGPPIKTCLLCKRVEPKRDLASCLNCSMTVHSSCYGIPAAFDDLREWICDLCDMEEGKKASLQVRQPICLLCPTRHVPPKSKFTALDCMKLTEFDNYIHLICAVWHPELKMTVPAELGDAEGLSTIPSKRRAATCVLCKTEGVGACVKCAHCTKMFHVSCAWLKSGYKFGFEMHPLKKKRPKDFVPVTFKEEEGEMRPAIWCNEHTTHVPEQTLHELGTRDPNTKWTAMQAYARTMKSSPEDTFMLLRRARRLDAIVEPVLNPARQNLPDLPPGTSWSRDSTLSPLPESPSPRKKRLPETLAHLGEKRAHRSSGSSSDDSSFGSLDGPSAKRIKGIFDQDPTRESTIGAAEETAIKVEDGGDMMEFDERRDGDHPDGTGSTTPTEPVPTYRYSFAGLIARLNKARRMAGFRATPTASPSLPQSPEFSSTARSSVEPLSMSQPYGVPHSPGLNLAQKSFEQEDSTSRRRSMPPPAHFASSHKVLGHDLDTSHKRSISSGGNVTTNGDPMSSSGTASWYASPAIEPSNRSGMVVRLSLGKRPETNSALSFAPPKSPANHSATASASPRPEAATSASRPSIKMFQRAPMMEPRTLHPGSDDEQDREMIDLDDEVDLSSHLGRTAAKSLSPAAPPSPTQPTMDKTLPTEPLTAAVEPAQVLPKATTTTTNGHSVTSSKSHPVLLPSIKTISNGIATGMKSAPETRGLNIFEAAYNGTSE